MQKYKRILFVGFRCSGKTTLSNMLSKKINIQALDTDKEIEKEQNSTINEITKNGNNWQLFRELELKKIKELLNKNNIIISAGGGVGVNNIPYNNQETFGDLQRKEILNSEDTLKILLETDENIIRQRLYENKIKENNRPDLKSISSTIEEYIENNIKIMKERENYYNKMANIKYKTNDKNKIDDIIENINDNYFKL